MIWDTDEDANRLLKLQEKIEKAIPKIEELTKMDDSGMNVGMSNMCGKVRKMASEILEILEG